LLAAVRQYFVLDVETGRTGTSVDVGDLAHVCVRIAEPFQYRPTIDDLPFDGDAAERVLTALLRA
jgi:hypothetical protein